MTSPSNRPTADQVQELAEMARQLFVEDGLSRVGTVNALRRQAVRMGLFPSFGDMALDRLLKNS